MEIFLEKSIDKHPPKAYTLEELKIVMRVRVVADHSFLML